MLEVGDQRQREIEDLCRHYGVRRLDLFGSHSSGNVVATSDIDFLVDFADAGPQGAADRYFGLLDGLRTLLGRPVDLVVRRALRNPYVRNSAERQSRPVYAA